MGLSFSIGPDKPPRKNSDGKIPVLVTGATGNIGSYFVQQAPPDFHLRSTVTKSDERALDLSQYGEVVELDITDEDQCKAACEGIDTVIHLAGQADEHAAWSSLLPLNITGSYNMMVAALAAGCRRLVYASSIHAISGYPADVQVKSTDPPNPGDLYGVSKCFGEALGRYMAVQEGLSVIALRIGGFQPKEFATSEDGPSMLDAWISRRDMAQMLELSVRNANLEFAIFNGLSDNRFKRMDITHARELLGYRPQDDLTEINPELKPLHLDDVVRLHSLADDPSRENSGIREDL